MNAIIYAAGRATRLGPAFANSPKILLPIAGRSLLDWHAERLASVGVQHLFIVTGHCRDQVAKLLPELSSRHGLRLHELYNPDYTEGSVISMNVSLAVVEPSREPVLLMDGDVLYDAELLRRLLVSPHPSAMLVDFGVNAVDDDPVLVPVCGGRPLEFMKKWSGSADRVGESVGFFKIAPEHIPLLALECRSRTAGLSRCDSLDEVFRVLVKAGVIGIEDITGQPWTEIDFPHDVAYAREVVLPALEARASVNV